MATRNYDESELRPIHVGSHMSAVPFMASKDPSLPTTVPTTSWDPGDGGSNELDPPKKRFKDQFYKRETREYFGRTCKNWVYIISYSIMYLIFLSTFTMVLLYASLQILKLGSDFKNIDKMDLLTYPEHGIGLTAAPTSETNFPLIWYKNGDKDEYEKYVQALDKLLSSNRRKREVNNLGPCGQHPYGYGKKPCVIVKINRQLKWSGQPLLSNSTSATTAPAEVKKWMEADKTKLWLHCSGYHSYDKEHIGQIKYYPDPPGFDADMFPLVHDNKSPLVAIQISDFTVGISLSIQCKLWYDAGPSTVDFMLYVAPEDKVAYTAYRN